MQNVKNDGREEYLDSVRGLAALQVLLLHLFSAYIPDLVFGARDADSLAAQIHRSPLFFLYDGYMAVYLFFTLSGFVLTRSIMQGNVRLPQFAGSRVVRLGIPSACACIFSAALYVLFAGHNLRAGEALHSGWLASLWHPALSLASILRDSTVNALLLGYRESAPGGTIPGLNTFYQSITASFASPLWTMSIEVTGSILTYGLCVMSRCRYRSLVYLLLFVLLVRNPYICFLIGHLAAVASMDKKDIRPSIPLFMIAGGVAISTISEFWRPAFLLKDCSVIPIVTSCSYPAQIQKIYGAALVFLAVIICRPIRPVLMGRLPVLLGKISFPLYLFHWPIVIGLSAYVFNCSINHIGATMGCALALAIGLICSLIAARLFVGIDEASIIAARYVRQSGQRQQSAAGPSAPDHQL